MRIGLVYSGDDKSEIWGCSITTYYLSLALQEMGHYTWRVSVDCPADWAEPIEEGCDLMIVEGTDPHSIPPALMLGAGCTLFWWLSELYFNLDNINSAPFDGIAVNSGALAEELENRKLCAQHIDLAAPECLATEQSDSRYLTPVIFVGSFANKSREQAERLLRPATEYGLTIWGYGWEGSGFEPWYRGVLPFHDLGRAYRSATVVLALTEQRQARLGLINNRIFEALAAGAILISEPHPVLEKSELGQYLHFIRSDRDVHALLKEILADKQRLAIERSRAESGQKLVLHSHTYKQRAEQFILLYQKAIARKGFKNGV